MAQTQPGQISSPPAPPRSIVVPSTQFSTPGQAKASYPYQLLMPASVPAQFKLQSVTLNKTPAGAPEVAHLIVRYVDSNGHYLEIHQGVPVPYDNDSDPTARLAPDSAKGVVTVQGRPAYWRQGTAVGTGTPGKYAWQQEPVMTLRWKSVPASNPNASTGYELQSDVLTRDQLVQIANSVQPYTGP